MRSIKVRLGFVFLIILACAVVMAAGSNDPSDPIQAIIHINFEDTTRQAIGLQNISNILLDVDGNAELEVVCHSKGIGLVLAAESVRPDWVVRLIDQGVEFVACENTLRERGLEEKDLIPGVGRVSSGAVEIIEKQLEGFAYFRP